jgi:hypothetical protein
MSAGLIPQLHPLVRSVIQEVESHLDLESSVDKRVNLIAQSPPPVSQI